MATTLTSMFKGHKEVLSDKLKGLSLPKDTKQVAQIVSEFLQNMFENDGEYRQGLTQSEDYILQSAIQLLNAQQSIASEIASMSSSFNDPRRHTASTQNVVNPYNTIVASGAGALVGGLLGTWGAICGAIAGTAISVYLATRKKNIATTETVVRTINVEAFLSIIQKICESIDDLMETYRVQVTKIRNSYEQKEVVSFLSAYSTLAEQIANVLKSVKANESELNPRVLSSVQMLENSLENYNLKFENGKIIND